LPDLFGCGAVAYFLPPFRAADMRHCATNSLSKSIFCQEKESYA
jgi:hypothetical protein